MRNQPSPATVGDFDARVEVLAEEVRAYLSLHGGALEEHDEQALARFSEVFLMPALAAVWDQGHRTPSPALQTVQPDTSPHAPFNPYASARLTRRTLWWHRLLRAPRDRMPE